MQLYGSTAGMEKHIRPAAKRAEISKPEQCRFLLAPRVPTGLTEASVTA